MSGFDTGVFGESHQSDQHRSGKPSYDDGHKKIKQCETCSPVDIPASSRHLGILFRETTSIEIVLRIAGIKRTWTCSRAGFVAVMYPSAGVNGVT
jgi:hypothetical protein